MSPYMMKIIAALDEDLKRHLDVNDLSSMMMGPMADMP